MEQLTSYIKPELMIVTVILYFIGVWLKQIQTLKDNAEASAARSIPAWLEFNQETMSGTLLTVPVREQIDVPVNEQLVVEFYAR